MIRCTQAYIAIAFVLHALVQMDMYKVCRGEMQSTAYTARSETLGISKTEYLWPPNMSRLLRNLIIIAISVSRLYLLRTEHRSH